MIIGITGTLGAGKRTVVEFLSKKGFRHYSVRAFLVEELSKRGIDVNRENMISVVNDLQTRFGQGFIIEELYKRALSEGGDAVIGGIRFLEEIEFLKKQDGFFLFSVDADIEIRYSRIIEMVSDLDRLSFDQFVLNDQRDMESGIQKCIEMADYNFKNDWTVDEMCSKVERVLSGIRGVKSSPSSPRIFSAGILSDGQIRKRVKTGEIKIIPFYDDCIQPASYDLHLDDQFKVFKPYKTEFIDTKNPVKGLMEDADLEGRDSFVLHPGTFALALIKEVTGVNNKHVGRLEGKSSLARLGLIIHTTAGFLDPGNSLQLTLELFNASPLPIKLYPGMKIAQIAFEELQEECEVPYGKERGSSYYGATRIQESQMHKNFENFDSDTGFYNPGK